MAADLLWETDAPIAAIADRSGTAEPVRAEHGLQADAGLSPQRYPTHTRAA